MATVSAFPDYVNQGGPLPLKQVDYPPDFEVIRYQLEDGGLKTNVRPCGPVRVVLEYLGLSVAEAAVLDAHYALAKGKVNTFPYFDRRAGRTYTLVRYDKYEIIAHERYWSLGRRITLVREA